ncbi:uncharacterized protein KIAA1522-like [Impatiens glandulifera]|uniref:uncharacterized protein KIAA1522-like n=1 Tax=Impatiens glandulifera TaxID=253017 RepID=UPI001FB0D701|nr:uncharacterized protein KIAA1522-like [Impatiens glandulifera]
MDPSLTNPPPAAAAVWNPPEQENYMAPAANPAPTNGHSNPSYPEMVLAAIGALKEKDGSSRQAIAKYIEQVYTDLPSDNSVLLTRHLKLMKQAGQLIMVKHSYMLPGSASFVPQPAPVENGPSIEPKRRSGRPSKLKVDYQLVVAPTPPVQESIFVSLGLDEPVPPSPPAVQDEIDVSQAHSVFGKRGRGRPPKLTPVHIPVQQTAPASASQNGSKRKRGRPSKLESVVQRLGGRPKKVPKPTNGTPRGRPPKYVVLTAAGSGKEQAGVTPEKRRGRRKGSSLKKSRRLSGKPLGRPRKKLLVGREGGAEQNQVPPAHGDDLVKKLEYIQEKIKQVVSAVKPHLNSITAANALGELQELEQLASEKLQVNHPLQLPADSPPAQITIVSQKPVLVPPPAHFSVPTSVPIAAPDMYPISYSTFQAAYQAQSLH